jgi:putative CocE/NonD family hydrolase
MTAPRIVVEDTVVTTPDGVRLATDVTVADDGHRHPVLLMRTPYSRASVRGFYDAIGLARLGWAVVTQDVRGRWDSTGDFVPFANERADGFVAVEWCASQPWSNGAVAMTGGSYNGGTQWLAAADGPRGLRAISPAVIGPSIRDDVTYENGVAQFGLFTGWALGVTAMGSRLDADTVKEARAELDAWPALAERPLAETVLARATPAGLRWLSYEDDGFWAAQDVSAVIDSVNVAGYHLAGWHDIFVEGNLRAYQAMTASSRSDEVRASQRLVVGPWAHATMLRRTTGELDFGVAADGAMNGLVEEQLMFLTEAVAGRPVPGGARIYVMGRNEWIDLPSWPPPATATVLHLGADGTLSFDGPGEAAADSYAHDPASPVPTWGGRTLHPVLPEPGPRDQREVESRPDVLVFTTDELASDLTVMGLVRAHVAFASTATEADVTVKLVDVYPDGRAMLVVDSIRHVSLTPGSPTLVTVEVGSTGQTFAAGHRIRVEIASSNYPRFGLSPAATQTIHHGGRTESRLELPVYTDQA